MKFQLIRLIARVCAILLIISVFFSACFNKNQEHSDEIKSSGQAYEKIEREIPPGQPSSKELDMDFYAKDPDAFMSNDPNVHALVIPETGKYFWEKPTTKEYPEIDAPEKFRIEVSVADQRVYIFRDDKKVCTLICSTGATDSPTVTGDFELFAKRGDTFYTERFGGGNYWITFYKTYLFHSVPIDSEGYYIIEECIKLGQPASHGCIRLSIADARWFYNNMPAGIPVKVY